MLSHPVNATLASLVDKMVKTSLSEEKTKEKHEKYYQPGNCENLINTRVNPEIWSKVRSNTRSRNLKVQTLETNRLKSMIPIVKIADKSLTQNLHQSVMCLSSSTLIRLPSSSGTLYY